MPSISLLNTLQDLCTGKAPEKDITQLIRYCYKIALGYLFSKYSSEQKMFNKFGIKFDDFAMDSIAPLFFRKNPADAFAIVKSYRNWKQPLENENDIEFFLVKVVISSVEQSVTNKIKEQNPYFEKIHKTLSTCILNNNLKKIDYLGTKLVVYDEVGEINAPVINDADFDSLPSHLFREKQFALFEGILSYIENNTENFPAIPFNNLIKRIINLYLNSEDLPSQFAGAPDKSIETGEIIEFALSSLIVRLKTSYLDKRKITEEEFGWIKNAFIFLSGDLQNTGHYGSLYSYLQRTDGGLSQEEFYLKYHSIMNYLLKSFKEDLLKNFKD